MKLSDCHIGFIGFGHLAQAMYHSFKQTKLVPRSHYLFTKRDLSHCRELEQKYGITATSLEHLVETSDLLLICVRPQDAKNLLEQLAKLSLKATYAISFLAGTHLAQFQETLPASIQLLRALPNLAASCGESMTLLSYGAGASTEFRSLSHLLLSTLGKTIEIPENLMDMGTGLAGSGIAFALYLIDAMARYGATNGIPYEESLPLAAQVFRGASELILTKKAHPQDLLEQIATPGGTTQAGLNVLQKTPAARHLHEAIAAAASRANQLSSH